MISTLRRLAFLTIVRWVPLGGDGMGLGTYVREYPEINYLAMSLRDFCQWVSDPASTGHLQHASCKRISLSASEWDVLLSVALHT
jgi:hypothetical protein